MVMNRGSVLMSLLGMVSFLQSFQYPVGFGGATGWIVFLFPILFFEFVPMVDDGFPIVRHIAHETQIGTCDWHHVEHSEYPT